MIWRPKKGQMVRIHYRKSAAEDMTLHGCEGIVESVASGPGPINALVEVNTIDQMTELFVIPRGNLVAAGDEDELLLKAWADDRGRV